MRNIEALKNYFLGKDPQLKETMADNSLRLIGIEGKHFVLRTELIKGLHDLREHVDEKDVELQGEIDGLIRDLSGESTARENADTQIYLRMGDIDTLLREDLRTEVLARISGDNQLNNKFSDYYTKDQVDQLISILPTFDIEVVQTLPTEDISETTIYLVPSQDPQTANSYDEFIYVSNNWEQIGSTAIDLSNYYTKAETDSLVSGFQPEITNANKLSSDLVDDAGHTNKLVTNAEKNTWNSAIRGAGTNGSSTLYLVDGTSVNTQLGSGRFGYASTVYLNGSQLAPMTFPNVFLLYTTQMSNEIILHIVNLTPRNSTTEDILEWTISQDTTNFVWGSLQQVDKPKEIPTLSGTVHMTALTGGIYYLKAGASVDDGNSNVLFSAGSSTGGATRVGILKVTFSYYVSGRNTYRLWNYYYYSDVTEGLITYGRVKKTNSGTPTSTNNTLTLNNIKTTAFTGTDGTTAGTIGLVPAPATTDTGKFLCADGTWQTSGGGTTITYGTTDLTPGVSPLAEGTFYFQYE